MAIKQERMMALVGDYAALRVAFEEHARALAAAIDAARLQYRGAEANAALSFVAGVALPVAMPSSEAFAVERYHFAKSAKRNARERVRMRERRKRQQVAGLAAVGAFDAPGEEELAEYMGWNGAGAPSPLPAAEPQDVVEAFANRVREGEAATVVGKPPEGPLAHAGASANAIVRVSETLGETEARGLAASPADVLAEFLPSPGSRAPE